MKKLLFAALILMLKLSAHSQTPLDSNRVVPVPVKLITEVTDSLAVGNMAKRENRRLKKENAELQKLHEKLKAEIHADSLLLADMALRLSADDAFVTKQNEIIREQGNQLVYYYRQERKVEKTWQIAPAVGGGLLLGAIRPTYGGFIGLVVTPRNLSIRFGGKKKNRSISYGGGSGGGAGASSSY